MTNGDYLGDEVLMALRRIVRAIDLHSRKLAQQHGVTGPQILILKRLSVAPEVAVGELARKVSLSQATVTDILDRLERRGLVMRVRSTSDKRRVLVCATDEGKRLLKSSPPLLQENFVQRLRALPDWEQTLILSSLQRVGTMLEVDRLDAAPMLSSGSLVEPPDAIDPPDAAGLA